MSAQSSQKQYPCGTHARYVLNRCRCDDCRDANRRYERRRTLWLAGAIPGGLVDSAPVLTHIEKLRAAGMGSKRIGQQAGVPPSAVGSIIWGRKNRKAEKVRAATAAKLLALELDLADGAKVPGREARAIVAELVARGWSKAAIGRRVHGPMARSLQLGDDMVFASTVRALRVLLDEPVPLRKHYTGSVYKPKGRPPRKVRATTAGVGKYEPEPVAEVAQVLSAIGDPAPNMRAIARGKLACRVCGRALVDHRLTERCA